MISPGIADIKFPLLAVTLFTPLVGAFFVSVRHNSGEQTQRMSGWLATMFSLVAFLTTVLSFSILDGSEAPSLFCSLGTWFSLGELQVDFRLRLDHLSGVLCLVVTGVGT